MTTPHHTKKQLQALCTLNEQYQSIDWLRYAQYEKNPSKKWTIIQQEHRIELHECNEEYVLLLWIANSPSSPPMDNVHPQWDSTLAVQVILENAPTFPNALLWSPSEKNEWRSLWLATQWWPLEGITDAVDNPNGWLHWWWYSMMEFTTPPPCLYDAYELQ